jgi:hypothetical protein
VSRLSTKCAKSHNLIGLHGLLRRQLYFLYIHNRYDSWTGDETNTGPPITHRTTQTQNKRTQTSMPPVGFEADEQKKAVHSLDVSTTTLQIVTKFPISYRIRILTVSTSCLSSGTERLPLRLARRRQGALRTSTYTGATVVGRATHMRALFGTICSVPCSQCNRYLSSHNTNDTNLEILIKIKTELQLERRHIATFLHSEVSLSKVCWPVSG